MKKRFLSIFIFALTLIAFTAQNVYATSGYFFDGGYIPVANIGASASIETQNPYITTGGSSSSWVMTANSSGQNYALSGWTKDPGFTAPKYFCEAHSDVTNAFYQKFLGTAATGSTNQFETSWDNSSGTSGNVMMRVNGTDYLVAPAAQLQWSPNEVQIFSETHDTVDQCSGSSGNHVTVGALHYKNTAGTWIPNPVFTFSKDLATMSYTSTTTSWDVWDNRY